MWRNARRHIYIRTALSGDECKKELERQKRLYQNLLAAYPNWQRYKFYIDRGKANSPAGTIAFINMKHDAMSHKFDLIITESLTKFGRNIKAGIAVIRDLAGRIPPIGVILEKEHIYSLSQKDMMALDFLLMVANTESENRNNAVNEGSGFLS